MKIKQIKNFLELLGVMTGREIKTRYKRTVFGFLWFFLNPVAKMAIIGTVFSLIVPIPRYYLFVLVGLVAWMFFSTSIMQSVTSLTNSKNLIKKSKFPIEVIPISIVLANFIHLVVSLSLLVGFVSLRWPLNGLKLGIVAVVVIWLLLISLGMSMLVASLYVRFRDLSFASELFLNIWFYATPIIYSLEMVPKKMLFLTKLNPLVGIFELLHVSLIGVGGINREVLFFNAGVSLLLVVVGVWAFEAKKNFFVDWM